MSTGVNKYLPQCGFQKGHTPWLKGKKVNRAKYPKIGHIIKHSRKTKEKMSANHWDTKGKNNPSYKDGRTLDKPTYKRYQRYKRKGLLLKTIQLVYEDNIKKYGTLTCYLCLKPIVFGNDQLDHKIPVSRDGNNEYENLGVACAQCNGKKNNKTVEEYQAKQLKDQLIEVV